jgi:CBS domain-containing membrane protein
MDESGLKVRDLMSEEVTTLRRDERLILADDLMRLGRIRHIPIVSEDETEVVGILSQRDLFRCAFARAVGYGDEAQGKAMEGVMIGDVMVAGVRSTVPEEDIAEAARTMLLHKVGCLPVIKDGRLVGILTEADFVKHVGRLS